PELSLSNPSKISFNLLYLFLHHYVERCEKHESLPRILAMNPPGLFSILFEIESTLTLIRNSVNQ
ncbi:MAG: hypothetical protein QW797_09360, partial [Thermoproteota archaeon]